MKTIVTHVGSTRFFETFAWANRQDTLADKIVLSIGCVTQSDDDLFAALTVSEQQQTKCQLDELHLCKIDLAHEVLVLNKTDYIGQSTLHEMCYAFNKGLPLRWLEDWLMDCSVCGCSGRTSEHFFHQALTLEEFERLASDPETIPYLVGRIVNWHGCMAPVVAFGHDEVGLQIDLNCEKCKHPQGTSLVVAKEGEFSSVVLPDGETFFDLSDADQRRQTLLCASCQQAVSCAPLMRTLCIRFADTRDSDIVRTIPISQLPDVLRPLYQVIAAPDFERITLRQGIVEITVTTEQGTIPLPFAPVPTTSQLPVSAVHVC